MGKRKEFTGIVISNKMQKTVIVKTTRLSKDQKYHRILKQYNKFKAHDEKGIAKMGDTVLIEETRPLSKDKRFRVVKVVKQAILPHVEIKEEITT
ncbi:MAG: 30S ribosomal protein S17 [Candidatus Omnitrophica bacterium]|nr:30S ribosomal protein S17 [Candidatus Omnitrophota bacterium]MDD5166136.1 30S ribosomal protein S17 [Candidatus Omnitrophota bacterium]